MSFRSYLQARLADDAAGSYSPNHFLLRLDKDNPFIQMVDENAFSQNNDYIDIFLHEYWHYWHNISTFSGIKTFSFTQDLVALLNRALLINGDGIASPSIAFNSKDNSEVTALLTLQSDHDGLAGPFGCEYKWGIAGEFVRYVKRKKRTRLKGRLAPNDIVTATFIVSLPGGVPSQRAFHLGSLAIEESVAYAVQSVISDDLLKDHAAPEFPYHVIERILQKEVGSENATPFACASIGTLALMSSHPGPALLSIIDDLKSALRATGGELLNAIGIVKQHVSGNFNVYLPLVNGVLGKIESFHEGHGFVENATQYIVEQARLALSDRSRELLFDLAEFFPRIDIKAFAAHQEKFPPCDLLQEREGDSSELERDIIYSFTSQKGDDPSDAPGNWMRSLQAQQVYLESHTDHSRRAFVDTDEIVSSCPYYTMCDLEIRRSTPEVCSKRPWSSYRTGEPQCWYAHAVAATMGTVNTGRGVSKRKSSAESSSNRHSKREAEVTLDFRETVREAVGNFVGVIIDAVKASTLQELLELTDGAPTARKPGKRRGRPPGRSTSRRKLGRPAKAATKRAGGTAATAPAKKRAKIAWPKCKHPGCEKNAWRRGDGYCGDHFKAKRAS